MSREEPCVLLTSGEYLAHLSSDGISLAEGAELDLSAPVHSCPGWDVAELVRHTGGVHRHKAAIIRSGSTQDPRIEWPVPAADDDLLAWYREGLDDLLRVLRAHPDTPAYSWAGDHRVAFWQRRMAQETLVHRWDAECAVGVFTPVDAVLAADGVDELLRVFAIFTDEPYTGPDGRIRFRSLDTGHAWNVTLTGGALHIAETASRADADAEVSAAAAPLLLALWRRLPHERLTIEGRRDLAEAFLGWIDET